MREERYLSSGQAAEGVGDQVTDFVCVREQGDSTFRGGRGEGRARRYRAEDVRRLKERKDGRRDPEGVVRAPCTGACQCWSRGSP